MADSWIHRHLCDVLEDMRRCSRTHNYASLKALIEEAQIMGNRMEAGLEQKADLQRWDHEWHRTRSNLKKLDNMAKAKMKKYNVTEEQLDLFEAEQEKPPWQK